MSRFIKNIGYTLGAIFIISSLFIGTQIPEMLSNTDSNKLPTLSQITKDTKGYFKLDVKKADISDYAYETYKKKTGKVKSTDYFYYLQTKEGQVLALKQKSNLLDKVNQDQLAIAIENCEDLDKCDIYTNVFKSIYTDKIFKVSSSKVDPEVDSSLRDSIGIRFKDTVPSVEILLDSTTPNDYKNRSFFYIIISIILLIIGLIIIAYNRLSKL